jgi:AraC family transcriptional regulator
MTARLPQGHFLGTEVLRRNLGNFLLNETRYPAHARLPAHAHQNAYLCLILRGGYTEVYGKQTRSCVPMTVAFHPPGEVHAQHFHDDETRSFNVEIAPAWLLRVGTQAPVLTSPAEWHGGWVSALGLRLYREFQVLDAVSGLAIEGLVLQIAAELFRQRTAQPSLPRWLALAREMIHDRFAESLHLADIAAEVGVHPVYLASAFRKHFRCTVGEYLRQRRVEFACTRLALSHVPLVEIALAAGFSDQSHFCRTFKRHTGMTPTAYRQARFERRGQGPDS